MNIIAALSPGELLQCAPVIDRLVDAVGQRRDWFELCVALPAFGRNSLRPVVQRRARLRFHIVWHVVGANSWQSLPMHSVDGEWFRIDVRMNRILHFVISARQYDPQGGGIWCRSAGIRPLVTTSFVHDLAQFMRDTIKVHDSAFVMK